MTTIEARVAQSDPTIAATARDAAHSPTPQAPGDVTTISDYQAAKAALLAQPNPSAQPNIPDDLEQQIARDEFGDMIHDPDADAGVFAAPKLEPEIPQATEETQPENERLLPHRIPTKQFSREEQEALALKHLLETENPGQTFSLKECLERVEAKYGKQPVTSTAATQTPDEPETESQLPQTLAELEAQKRANAKAIRDKRTEIARAESELRYDDKLSLTEELNALEQANEQLDDYAPRLASFEEQRSQQFTQAYQASAARTVALYPDAQVQGSAFYNRMAEIDALFKETGDPRFHLADKPLIIAQMVAQELQVAPRGKGAAARPSPNAPQPPVILHPGNTPAHLAAPVASGSARTTTPTVSNTEAAIAAVSTPEQLEALKLKLLGRRAA